jgi:hypothetical protein
LSASQRQKTRDEKGRCVALSETDNVYGRFIGNIV